MFNPFLTETPAPPEVCEDTSPPCGCCYGCVGWELDHDPERVVPKGPESMSPKDPDTYYPKFLVIRRSNCEVVDPTTCFTLIPDHDPHARVALEAYCNSCEQDMPGLASALRAHFGLTSV